MPLKCLRSLAYEHKNMPPRQKRAYHRRRMLFNLYCEDRIASENGVVKEREKSKQSSGIDIEPAELRAPIKLRNCMHLGAPPSAFDLDFRLIADLDLNNLVYDAEKWQIDRPYDHSCWDSDWGTCFVKHKKTGKFMNRFLVKWNEDKYNTFTCFSNLPTELRLMIWKHALPGPRVVQLGVFQNRRLPRRDESYLTKHLHVLFSSLGNDKLPLDICREWREVCLQHYSQLEVPDLKPFKYKGTEANKFSFHLHIDPKVDTLELGIFRNSRFTEMFKLHLDLSKVEHLALIHRNNRLINTPNMWACVKAYFPSLKTFEFFVDMKDRSEDILLKDIKLGRQALAVLDKNTLENLYYNITTVGDSRKARRLREKVDEFLENGKGVQTEYSELALADPDYWGKVKFNLAFFTIEIVNRKENFYVKRKNRLDTMFFFETQIPNVQNRVEFYDLEVDFACKEDGSLYHQYQGVKELFER